MGWLQRLLGRDSDPQAGSTVELGLGMGADGELEPAEGGPHPFVTELSQLRWSALNEGVAVARKSLDPEMWDGGQLMFDVERGLAEDHEGLRDRLSNFVAARVREQVEPLYELAAEIGSLRDAIRQVDLDLIEEQRDFRRLRALVVSNDHELGRYGRLRSTGTQVVKYGLVAIFVAAEWMLTSFLFEGRIPVDLPGLGFLLALGVLTAFIAVPHFAAHQLKSGGTRYHKFDDEPHVERAAPATKRAVHHEEVDDLGSKISAYFTLGVMVALIWPISVLRAEEIGDGGAAWFWLFALVQLVISGYFFMREWGDHGNSSHDLKMLKDIRDGLVEERADLLAAFNEQVAEFHTEAEQLIFTIREAPRWDDYIVRSFNATSHYFRHVITQERPDLDPFVTWARMPYLGPASDVPKSDYPLDPMSSRDLSLDFHTPRGRLWWIEQMVGALAEINVDPEATDRIVQDKTSEDVVAGWLYTKAPNALLAGFVKHYHGIDVNYERPAELDELPDEPPLPAPRPSSGDAGLEDGTSGGTAAVDTSGKASETTQPLTSTDGHKGPDEDGAAAPGLGDVTDDEPVGSSSSTQSRST